MAVVKVTKTRTTGRTWTTNRASIKASIRYIMHRPTLDGERGRRELFTNAGEKLEKDQAYWMIDDAGEGTKFIRIVLSPDPVFEDTNRDLDMRTLTIATIEALQRRLKRPIRFIAALHDDHTDKRHCHIIALCNRPLYGRDFQAMIRSATFEAKSERRSLDRIQGMRLEKTMRHGRVVVTARRGQQREAYQSQTTQTVLLPGGDSPPCPKAGPEGHPVKQIKPGLYWCRTCREAIREQTVVLTRKERELELKLA